MAKRLQSPSSINTYMQCPRKYFYQYILKFPVKQNIHCIRGNIVHEALEKFYDIDIDSLDQENYKKDISFYLKNRYQACWISAKHRLNKLGLTKEQLEFYNDENVRMLANWVSEFFKEIDAKLKEGHTLSEAYNKLKPIELEKQYKCKNLMVRGFIDVIHKDGNDIIVLDYKTSKSDEIKKEYLRQLGIYAALYEKTHGVLPKKVGIWFLKHKPKIIDVTPKMVKDALFDVEQIHFATESESISDYPKKRSGLCKYSTGQCDFYHICMKDR